MPIPSTWVFRGLPWNPRQHFYRAHRFRFAAPTRRFTLVHARGSPHAVVVEGTVHPHPRSPPPTVAGPAVKAEEPEPSDGVMVRYVTDDEAAFEWSSAERRDDGECPGLAVLSKRTYFRSAALATLLCPFTFVDSIHYLRVHLKVRGGLLVHAH